jgi:hypothetical protein
MERLASNGTISISRGQIRVADRRKLEQITCECYAIVKQYYNELEH